MEGEINAELLFKFLKEDKHVESKLRSENNIKMKKCGVKA
jgi:hypothetical protein